LRSFNYNGRFTKRLWPISM